MKVQIVKVGNAFRFTSEGLMQDADDVTRCPVLSPGYTRISSAVRAAKCAGHRVVSTTEQAGSVYMALCGCGTHRGYHQS